jgi:ectoine hydroxylase-related dioxygenase (phytanoyl-CoA dioxygenase family)
LEVSKGSVILLHGDLVHFSGHNHSAESRHAYTLHLIEGHNNNWSKDAWLQRTPELPFRRYYERVD